MALDPGRNIGLNPDQVKNKLRILAKIFLLKQFVDYYLRHHSPSSCFAFNAGCGVKRRMGNMRGWGAERKINWGLKYVSRSLLCAMQAIDFIISSVWNEDLSKNKLEQSWQACGCEKLVHPQEFITSHSRATFIHSTSGMLVAPVGYALTYENDFTTHVLPTDILQMCYTFPTAISHNTLPGEQGVYWIIWSL